MSAARSSCRQACRGARLARNGTCRCRRVGLTSVLRGARTSSLLAGDPVRRARRRREAAAAGVVPAGDRPRRDGRRGCSAATPTSSSGSGATSASATAILRSSPTRSRRSSSPAIPAASRRSAPARARRSPSYAVSGSVDSSATLARGRADASSGTYAPQSSVIESTRAPTDTITHEPVPAPTIVCFVPGGQWTKSHARSGRSSPSTSRSASPETTRKSSWSASQW